MGVAPKAVLPSIKSVSAASMAAEVVSRLEEPSVGLESCDGAKNFDSEGTTASTAAVLIFEVALAVTKSRGATRYNILAAM